MLFCVIGKRATTWTLNLLSISWLIRQLLIILAGIFCFWFQKLPPANSRKKCPFNFANFKCGWFKFNIRRTGVHYIRKMKTTALNWLQTSATLTIWKSNSPTRADYILSDEKYPVVQHTEKAWAAALWRISTVIDIKVSCPEESIRITNMITGALNSKHSDSGKSVMHTQYIEYEKMLCTTLWGGITFVQKIGLSACFRLDGRKRQIKWFKGCTRLLTIFRHALVR